VEAGGVDVGRSFREHIASGFGVFGVAPFGCSMIIAFLVRDVVGDARRADRVGAG
jgi:hypothetical protein